MRILQKIIGRVKNFLGPQQEYVFSEYIDSVMAVAGKQAREYLETVQTRARKRVVYFLTYHHSKFAAMVDAVNILALQVRGVEVFAVRASFFFEREDVIFGGIYNKARFEQQFKLSRDEGKLLSVLLQVNTLALDAFLEYEERIIAHNFARDCSPVFWQSTHYANLPVGELAWYTVANMNNSPQMEMNDDHIGQYKDHIENIIKHYFATKRLLHTVKPNSVVSNVPFYYQWRIPYYCTVDANIPYYAFMLGERKNTIFWTHNSMQFYDAGACWDAFLASSMFTVNEHIVEQGMKDRYCGLISNHQFAPDARLEVSRLKKIRASIQGKKVILFPCNVLIDAAVLLPTQAFLSCLEMVRSVVEWFKSHPQYVCVLKAHPGEKLWLQNGFDTSKGLLRNVLTINNIVLPSNVIFIDFDEDISVYSLFESVKGIIAYSSSVCLDAGMFGLPSISMHTAHYSMAGFSTTPGTEDSFYEMLTEILETPFDEKRRSEIQHLAKVYYLLYYYVGQVDLKLYAGNDTGTIPVQVFFNSVEALQPGANATLDYICDAIIAGNPIFGKNIWPPVSV